MQFLKLRTLSAALAVSAMLACAPAGAADLNLTLAGASPGGLWTLLGAGLDSALKKAQPNATVTYQTSGGGFANAALVSQGKTQIGLIHDAELAIAAAGGEPFKAPIENLRTIGYLYDWAPMQFIASKSFTDQYGIESIADIAAKKAPVRLTVNRAGNITGMVASAMLSAAGADDKTIESFGGSIVQAGSSEQSKLITGGRVDVFANGVFVGHSSIREIENAIDIKLLSIPDNVIETVGNQLHIGTYTIPANSYENQPTDVKTLALGAVLVASTDMSEEGAYTLTKAMIDNIADIQGVHPAMKQLTLQLLTRQTAVPFHDGALRAYREAGLMQ